MHSEHTTFNQSAAHAFCSSTVLLAVLLACGVLPAVMPLLFGQMIFDIVIDVLDNGITLV